MKLSIFNNKSYFYLFVYLCSLYISLINGQFGNIPFSHLIEGPLSAVIEAQTMAAITTIDYITSIGYQEIDGVLTPIDYSYDYPYNSTEIQLAIPNLTLLPIPYFEVTLVKIDFNTQITSVRTSKIETSTNSFTKIQGDPSYLTTQVSIDTGYSSQQKIKDADLREEKFTMSVSVRAVPAAMPRGTRKILEIFEDLITSTIPDK